jgi:hypothetical protein
LCAQEVGMTVGNVLLVGGALGLRARVHHRFDDTVVNEALGLDGEEETAFAVVDLSPRRRRPAVAGPAPLPKELGAPLPLIRPHHVRTNAADPMAWTGLTELDRASRLTGEGGGTPVDQDAFHLPVGEPECRSRATNRRVTASNWPRRCERATRAGGCSCPMVCGCLFTG